MPVTVGILQLHLQIYADSLKGKRSVVKALIERVRSRYNAAVAEVDHLNAHERATIAVVCVSNEHAHADEMLQKIASFAAAQRLDMEILSVETEFIHG
jgi:hypothetical protein